MAGLNQLILLGNLTKDPELRYTAQGTAVANGRIAVNEKYGDKEETLFIDFVAWRKLAEIITSYLNKGNQVLFVGRLTERSWESDGQKRSKMEMVVDRIRFVGGKGKDGEDGEIEPF